MVKPTHFSFFLRGDTLIEVMFAVAVFGMVAVGSIGIMNRGLHTTQTALEVTMARQEIDAQAEALRFVHDAFVSSTPDSSDAYTELWQEIKSRAYTTSELTNNNPNFFSDYNNQSCDVAMQDLPDKSFLINPDSFTSSSLVSDMLLTNIQPAATYPRILRTDNNNPLSDATPSPSSGTTLATRQVAAEGIWVTAVQSDAGIDCGNGDVRPDFYDFYIRTCWDNPSGTSSTISSTIRLFNSEQIDLNRNPPISAVFEKLALYFVMSWNAQNSDIDAHLAGRPSEENGTSSFHVYFGDKTAGAFKDYSFVTTGRVQTFQLDVDALGASRYNYDPTLEKYCLPTNVTYDGQSCSRTGSVEVVAFRSLFPGSFRYMVNDWSGEGLSGQDLTVRVFAGFADSGIGRWPNNAPIATYTYDGSNTIAGGCEGIGSHSCWNVLTVDIGADGRVTFDGGRSYVDVISTVTSSTPISTGSTVCTPTNLSATYKINYHPNGGSGSDISEAVEVGQAINLRNNPFTAPAGNYFAGWRDRDTGTRYSAGQAVNFNKSADEEVNLDAIWREQSYHIQYEAISNGSTMPDTIVPLGQPATISANTFPAPEGQTFSHWNTNIDGSGTSYQENQTTSDFINFVDGQTITLYAQWQTESPAAIEHYHPRFFYNGGTFTNQDGAVRSYANNCDGGNIDTMERDCYIDGSSETAGIGMYLPSWSDRQETGLKRAGYTFTGWNSKKDGSGTHWDADQSYTYAALGSPVGDFNLYAEWRLDSQPVTPTTPASVCGDNIPAMQNWQNTLTANGSSARLCDERDGNSYIVTKIADGHVWMTQNLKLDFTNLKPNVAISDANTNHPSANFVNWARTYRPITSIDGKVTSTQAYVTALLNNNTADNYGHLLKDYGVYYTWWVAVAGTSLSGRNTTGDICPAGWHLPTANDATNLLTYKLGLEDKSIYYSTNDPDTTYPQHNQAVNKWRGLFAAPMNFTYAGAFTDEGFINNIKKREGSFMQENIGTDYWLSSTSSSGNSDLRAGIDIWFKTYSKNGGTYNNLRLLQVDGNSYIDAAQPVRCMLNTSNL